MDKLSFLNRHPGISTGIIVLYIISIYQMIENSLTFAENVPVFVIYFIFVSFIIFIHSNIILRILKHDC